MFTINADITGLKTIANSGRPARAGQLGSDSLGQVDSAVLDVSGLCLTDSAVRNNKVEPTMQRKSLRMRFPRSYRVRPSRFAGFQGTGLNRGGLSVTRSFALTGTLEPQLRAEFLNAFNTPFFDKLNLSPNNASSDRLTSYYNLPRAAQIDLRLAL